MTPIANGVEIAEIQTILHSELNTGDSSRDFAGYKSGTTTGRFVVEQNTVREEHAISLAVVFDDPERKLLGNSVGRAGIKGGGLTLGSLHHLAVKLTRGGLIQTGFVGKTASADGVEQAEGSNTIHLSSILREIERNLHMTLSAEVVNLVGLNLRHQTAQVRGVRQISVVEEEVDTLAVRILVKVVNATSVEG